jgi:hypothetical protein
MSTDERASRADKPKGSRKEAYILKKDRPDFYETNRRVCKYTIGELADLFEYLEFQIKDSRTGQLSSPFYISITARGAKADEDLDDFTLQGLLDAINDLEWIVSRHKRKSRGKLSLIFCRKVGVD